MFSTLSLFVASLAVQVAALPSANRTGVRYVGANIAGFDFGITIQGVQTLSSMQPPLLNVSGIDGAGQMHHFVRNDGFNIFRLPVGWQYLVNSTPGGKVDAANFAEYNTLVQSCLNTTAHCIVDLHNYARWEGQIIGQGGPSNEQFASLWSQLATKYANNSRVLFGIMNEPHDLDVSAWVDTVQAVVTAIRKVAPKQTILLPGSNFTSAGAMAGVAGPLLLGVKNPDNSTSGLVFDVHQYLDYDYSGTHTTCVTNAISSFQPLATWLRANGRQAFTTETGGGNTPSCVQYVCELMKFLNTNSDVFLGTVAWAAGSFDPSTYELSVVPTRTGLTWTDSDLVTSCLKR
ncbi:glycoside hydrolase family 5 protein [Sporothrix schenckii 1099-18]|uniref:Endoglucanase EG-II n=1 Tax=Sporothrix schenckii 1099-18 TaxID=1397361 RepID=A0A0F2LTF8_SPOSC|nr:glycoside hydrolase family 5 protein [Sporothrix schenckii 1099-18]KJR79810.1 glycoside hydrolase family 5 protein [Sporothrix schenckii 1099-18]